MNATRVLLVEDDQGSGRLPPQGRKRTRMGNPIDQAKDGGEARDF